MSIAKEQEVLNYDGSLYRTARVFARAPDGASVPISIVYHKDAFAMAEKRAGQREAEAKSGGLGLGEGEGKEEGKEGESSFRPSVAAPMMLYGYGSYEICCDPGFDRRILPYLDRGVVYAIAHIRGGGEMGRHWYYDQGKYLNKRNTFSDFIACAERLVDLGWTTKDQLAIEGRSAGGLLVGAVINMRPDLFKVALAGVPFVDVMTTMSDPSIPLTTGEWEEWGNPNDARYFDYMLSYSPYDNVRAQAYPHLLITAGLHDPRVAYWEPAKWASKIRKTATAAADGFRDVVFKIDLDSGHFSASDRYKYLREKAWEQAYVMEKLGVAAMEIAEGAAGESKTESKM